MQLINYDLAKNPWNWAIILFMLIIAGAIGHYVLATLGIGPKKNSQLSPGTTGPSAYSDLPAGQVPSGESIDAINPATAGLVS